MLAYPPPPPPLPPTAPLPSPTPPRPTRPAQLHPPTHCFIQSPTISSDCPLEYTLAVSMKFPPNSTNLSIMAQLVFGSMFVSEINCEKTRGLTSRNTRAADSNEAQHHQP